MSREARVAMWLARLCSAEADALIYGEPPRDVADYDEWRRESYAEAQRLSEIGDQAHALGCELAGLEIDSDGSRELWRQSMAEWDRTAGACPDCGQHWSEMRRDGTSTTRAGGWLQRAERRTCACGRTISRLLEERDVQELGEPEDELEAFVADRISVFAAERDQRPSEVPAP